MTAFQPGDRVEVEFTFGWHPATVREYRPGPPPACVVLADAGLAQLGAVVVLANRCRPIQDADPVGPDHVVQAG